MHVVYGLKVGGLENVVVNLVNTLDRTRFNPVVCSMSSHRDLTTILKKGHIKTIHLNYNGRHVKYLLPIRLAGLIRREKVKILHTHNLAGFIYGVPAGIIAGVPVIIHTEHGCNFPEKHLIVFLRKIFSKFIDQIVLVSYNLRKAFFSFEKMDETKMTVIWNGIDEKRFGRKFEKNRLRSQYRYQQDDLLVGIVARLEPIKNHIMLLRGIRRVLQDVPGCRLLVIGDGSERERLVDLSKELDLQKYVRFFGERNDIPELLSIIDLFVLVSLSEGISLTLLEAMATGLPIIATKVGGNPELIRDGINGILIESGDENRLVAAIIEMLKNPVKRRTMGQQGYGLFQKYYTLDTSTKQYEQLYQRCLSRKGIF